MTVFLGGVRKKAAEQNVAFVLRRGSTSHVSLFAKYWNSPILGAEKVCVRRRICPAFHLDRLCDFNFA